MTMEYGMYTKLGLKYRKKIQMEPTFWVLMTTPKDQNMWLPMGQKDLLIIIIIIYLITTMSP